MYTESFIETHFEIVSFINSQMNLDDEDKKSILVKSCHEEIGLGGLYDLSIMMTLEFEKIHRDRQWDGEFLDEIDSYIDSVSGTEWQSFYLSRPDPAMCSRRYFILGETASNMYGSSSSDDKSFARIMKASKIEYSLLSIENPCDPSDVLAAYDGWNGYAEISQELYNYLSND
jgi:hypothetical protein